MAVANLTVPGGQDPWQEFHFPHCFLKFRSIFLIFPQTLLIFFLILALRVGESPTREGPGYVSELPVGSFKFVQLGINGNSNLFACFYQLIVSFYSKMIFEWWMGFLAVPNVSNLLSNDCLKSSILCSKEGLIWFFTSSFSVFIQGLCFIYQLWGITTFQFRCICLLSVFTLEITEE